MADAQRKMDRFSLRNRCIMETITVILPEYVIAFIQQEIAAGRFDDESAAITVAVERLMPSDYRWEEDEALLEAIAEVDRGEGIVITDMNAFFDQCSREASEAAERGDPIPYDVTY